MKVSIIGAAIFLAVLITGCSKNETENEQAFDEVPVLSGETTCEGGDDEDPQPMLRGTVVDSTTQDSITGVCVKLVTDQQVFVAIIGTDDNGHYYFNEVNDGDYNLVFYRSGYVTKTIPVSVSGTPQTVDAELRPEP